MRAHDFSDHKNLNVLASRLKKLDIQYIQLAMGISYPDLSEKLNPGMGMFFRKTLEKQGISIAIFSCYINLIHPVQKVRRREILKMKNYLKMCSFFGAGIVATETGSVLTEIEYTTKNFTEEAFQEVVFEVNELVEVAEKAGVVLGIEPGINHPLHTIEKTKRLIDHVNSSALGIILDPMNLLDKELTSEAYEEVIKVSFAQFGTEIVALHLKDFEVKDGRAIPVSMGSGLLNYKEIKNIISELCPHMFIILEETKEIDLKKFRGHEIS